MDVEPEPAEPAGQGEDETLSPEGAEGEPAPAPPAPPARLVGPSTQTVRVAWLLEQMQGDSPEVRAAPLNRTMRERFGVGSTCATRDIAEANRQIQEWIDRLAPYIGGQIKTSLTRIAVKAERSETMQGLDIASSTLGRLAKICGLEEKSEPSKAAALSPDQLDAAIAGHAERAALAMSDEEFSELVRKRADAKEGA